ncbi:MAG TPA: DnaJ domain-containing protein [Kofleriaceae bacterium]|nr:DnaJ domain-containing protein [Kofleriaceae bacterium]
MAEGALSIKLRCASWQQLATIYKRDLSHGTMFLRAATPPPVGTAVRIDLALPSATVIALEGVVGSHVQDPQRGAGVEITLSPIPASSVWLIESALASEHKRLATPVRGVPIVGASAGGQPAHQATGSIATIPEIHENAEVTAAEQDLVKALVSEAESLKKLNPFLVLGVGYEAGDADVRAAFGELTKRYHPDRFARYESAELRQLAAEIFILIRDAYRKLGDAAARAQVLQSLGKAAPAPRAVPGPHRAPASVPPPRATQRVPLLPSLPPVPGAPVAVMPPAPTAPVPSALRPPAAAGRGATRRPTGEPPPANPPAPPPAAAAPAPAPRRSTPSAPPAHTPSPRASTAPPVHTPSPRASTAPVVGGPAGAIDRKAASPFSHTQPAPVLIDPAEIAALESLIDQGRLDEALSGYRAMAKRHASDRNVRAGAELCEGLLALAARDRLEAAQRFETALEIDPSNERAARELAEMRRQATNERKGLLSRLMGKKEP